MTWKITRWPPDPGEHTLGGELLTFDDTGTAYTDSPDTLAQAQCFPETFTIVDLDQPETPHETTTEPTPILYGPTGDPLPREEPYAVANARVQDEQGARHEDDRPHVQDPGEGAGQHVITKLSDDRDAPSAEAHAPEVDPDDPRNEAQAQDAEAPDPSLDPSALLETPPQAQEPPPRGPGGRFGRRS